MVVTMEQINYSVVKMEEAICWYPDYISNWMDYYKHMHDIQVTMNNQAVDELELPEEDWNKLVDGNEYMVEEWPRTIGVPEKELLI